MHISELQREAWQTAEVKGHHAGLAHLDRRSQALVRLALIHTEVSEATQEVKRYGVDDLLVLGRIGNELADILIRTAELAETLGVDLQAHTKGVLYLNKQRPYGYGTPQEVFP